MSDILITGNDLLPTSSSFGAETKQLKTTEEMNFTALALEGAVDTVSLTVRKRNRKARNKCIQKSGWNCSVCDVNFEPTYGSIGDGFMLIQLLGLLSSSSDMREADPDADLILVCPNCQAMVRRRSPPISVEKIKTLVEAQTVRRALSH